MLRSGKQNNTNSTKEYLVQDSNRPNVTENLSIYHCTIHMTSGGE